MEEKIKCEACNREFGTQDSLASHNAAKHNPSLNKEIENKSKKGVFTYFVIAFFIVVGIIYFVANTGNVINEDIPQDNSNPSNNNEIQKITLSMKGNYYPNTITVKEGIPVEITLDNSIRGCFRSFNIKELGVSGYSSDSSQTIKFTPDKKGSFEFACGMRMGRGTIIVE